MENQWQFHGFLSIYRDFIKFNLGNNETESKRNFTFFETENCFFWNGKSPALHMIVCGCSGGCSSWCSSVSDPSFIQFTLASCYVVHINAFFFTCNIAFEQGNLEKCFYYYYYYCQNNESVHRKEQHTSGINSDFIDIGNFEVGLFNWIQSLYCR